jgi:gamma-glutamyltranspeptidase/glutathione hydrolase
MRTSLLAFLLLTYSPLVVAQRGDRSHGRSVTITQNGIAATSQTLASQAAAQILAQGGSAVDAAIAANAVLGVVEPEMDGIGGDLFVLYREAKTGKVHGLNGSGFAPRKWTPQYFASKKLKRVPSDGIDSVTVPGCVDGWWRMHSKFGKLPWRTLFQPAIAYAEQGFPLQETSAPNWTASKLTSSAENKRVFLPNGKPPVMGDIVRNPDLGRAMRLIADNGRDAFYTGEIAKAILATSRKLGGALAAEDLADFKSEWVSPITTDYRGWRVSELPPNGQGISALIMLNLMERFQPGRATNDAEWMHRKIESMKLAYSDLHTYIADPEFSKVPTAELLSKNYAAERARTIAHDANCDVKPGVPIQSDTTYLAVVDAEGNIASWIQSVSGMWASGVVVEGMGFHLQNRGAGFSLDPKHPNIVAPRKRPFHTIIPGILEKDGLAIGFGIMSGANQPLAHAQFVSNIVDHKLNLQAALEAPRFTKPNAKGCEVTIESRMGIDTIEELGARGHILQVRREYSTRMGRGNAVMHDAKAKVNYGASDPRADGTAIPQPQNLSK